MEKEARQREKDAEEITKSNEAKEERLKQEEEERNRASPEATRDKLSNSIADKGTAADLRMKRGEAAKILDEAEGIFRKLDRELKIREENEKKKADERAREAQAQGERKKEYDAQVLEL